jgi:hypothetical protein
MSHEFSSTRYFTDRGFLPPLDHGVMGSLLLSSSSSKNKNHHHQHHHRQHPQHPRGSPTNQTSDLDTTTDTSLSISSSSLSYPSLHGRSVPVTYTNDPKTVYRWMSDHLPYEGCTIGFDIEVSDCWDGCLVGWLVLLVVFLVLLPLPTKCLDSVPVCVCVFLRDSFVLYASYVASGYWAMIYFTSYTERGLVSSLIPCNDINESLTSVKAEPNHPYPLHRDCSQLCLGHSFSSFHYLFVCLSLFIHYP